MSNYDPVTTIPPVRPGEAPPPPRRLPAWLRRPLPTGASFVRTRALLGELALHTVCESAQCPNHGECWGRGTATFMIGGNRCTRACRFCAVKTARPAPLDADEPARVAEAARRLGLRHVVITSVARDDLSDGGAEHFRRSIAAVHQLNPGIAVEVLTPDFGGAPTAIATVLSAGPDVFNHNLETVRRLTPRVRSRATYERSLEVLRQARLLGRGQVVIKSGLMLGLGETAAEVLQALEDLRAVGCEVLTLGQYLQPTRWHLPVAEYVPPEQFARLGEVARRMGFRHVASAPLVRSSYHADDLPVAGRSG